MKLIIFDFDGPLNDLTEAKRITIKNLSEEFNMVFSDLASWSLINYIDQIYETKKIYDYRILVSSALEKLKDKQLITYTEEQKSMFSQKFLERLQKNQKLTTEILDVLKSIKHTFKNTKICIYTSQTQEVVLSILQYSEIDSSIFNKIYGRENFDEPKPSVSNLQYICNEFNIEPSEAVIVGDNVAVDLAPASYLGIKTILVNRFVDKQLSDITGLEDSLK